MALTSDKIQENIRSFLNSSIIEFTSTNIEKKAKEFNDIIITAANMSLKKPGHKSKNTRKYKNRKWFDSD